MKQREAARAHIGRVRSKESCQAGARSRGELERRAAESLRAEGFQVYVPNAVCDRVAIKDGKVYFVEFKRRGQQLLPAQQLVRNMSPENYIVRFYEE